jgi:hypothetical protein
MPMLKGGHDRGDDDDHEEEGDVRPDLDQALHEQIEPAAEVAHEAAEGDADQRRSAR